MRLPNWFRVCWWILLFVVTGAFLCCRWPALREGSASAFDVFVLLVWFGVVLCPLFSEIDIFGLKLKQEIQALRSQFTNQISSLASEVRTNVSMQVVQSSVQTPPAILPEKVGEELARSPMEFKILRTLFAKQVNRFDDLSQVWSMRLNMNTPEFFGFRDAATKLMKEGFVAETGHGQIYLTPPGFQYCIDHHEEFPPEQWWPEDPIDPERLKRVLGETSTSSKAPSTQ